MTSKAVTVREYLARLPADRRAALSAIREVILQNLDADYEEGMQYGMIGYYVPHRVFPPGYHCDPRQPLPFAGIASQKNHMSLYLMPIYGDTAERRWLEDSFARAGRKLDMGKGCIRFRRLEDLPLAVIGQAVRRIPAARYIEHYKQNIAARSAAGRKATADPPTARKPKTAKKKKHAARAKARAGTASVKRTRSTRKTQRRTR